MAAGALCLIAGLGAPQDCSSLVDLLQTRFPSICEKSVVLCTSSDPIAVAAAKEMASILKVERELILDIMWDQRNAGEGREVEGARNYGVETEAEFIDRICMNIGVESGLMKVVMIGQSVLNTVSGIYNLPQNLVVFAIRQPSERSKIEIVLQIDHREFQQIQQAAALSRKSQYHPSDSPRMYLESLKSVVLSTVQDCFRSQQPAFMSDFPSEIQSILTTEVPKIAIKLKNLYESAFSELTLHYETVLSEQQSSYSQAINRLTRAFSALSEQQRETMGVIVELSDSIQRLQRNKENSGQIAELLREIERCEKENREIQAKIARFCAISDSISTVEIIDIAEADDSVNYVLTLINRGSCSIEEADIVAETEGVSAKAKIASGVTIPAGQSCLVIEDIPRCQGVISLYVERRVTVSNQYSFSLELAEEDNPPASTGIEEAKVAPSPLPHRQISTSSISKRPEKQPIPPSKPDLLPKGGVPQAQFAHPAAPDQPPPDFKLLLTGMAKPPQSKNEQQFNLFGSDSIGADSLFQLPGFGHEQPEQSQKEIVITPEMRARIDEVKRELQDVYSEYMTADLAYILSTPEGLKLPLPNLLEKVFRY